MEQNVKTDKQSDQTESTIRILSRYVGLPVMDAYQKAFELSVLEMDIVYPKLSRYFDSLPPLKK
jgi:hypothetical protein